MGAAGRAMVAARFSAEHHIAALLEAYRTARATWESDRRSDSTRLATIASPAEPSRR
jgi:hypothetical protein